MRKQQGFAKFLRCFARIGLLSFGGPTAQIAVMHRELVARRGWMDEDEFLSALSFCMMLPGPEAMQLATYSGWQLRGVGGGLIAGLLFVLPGAAVMMALASTYVLYGDVPTAQALFLGVKTVVVVIVLQALFRLSKKALRQRDRVLLAVVAFLSITLWALPFPVIVLSAALYGAICAKDTPLKPVPRPKASHLPQTLAIWGGLWSLPLVTAWAAGQEKLLALGIFFSKLAIVTFGGAYAVLAYMSQEAVNKHGWLSADAMVDGLGLAETTPGPLILVTEFVGFLAASSPTGDVLMGLIGASLVLWVTFVPCFLWIFAGAPYIGWISGLPRLSSALQAITAAAFGVIAAMSYWFALQVYFGASRDIALGPLRLTAPEFSSFEPRAAAFSLLAALLIFALKRGLLTSMALVCLASLTISTIGAGDLFSRP